MAGSGAVAGELPRRVTIAFGLGALASGLIQEAVTTLALLFYNQVVGLSPALVGLALMISLVCDAIWDPAIGVWSDNLRSRLGRRHPFMYAAIVPAGVAFWLLWSPPSGLTGAAAFAYLLVTLCATRFCISLYEVPSTALIPEMAPDYDRRTSLISARYLSGVLGALTLTLLAFQVFLSDRAGGVINREGYQAFGLAGGAIIATILLLSTWGTHSIIAGLRPAPPSTPFNPALVARHVAQALANRNLVVILLGGVLLGMSAGLSQGLNLYINLYFWRFTTDQLSALAAPAILSSLVGVVLAPAATRRWGKKPVALTALWSAVTVATLPMILRLLGWLPGNEWPGLLPTIMAALTVAALMTLMGLIAITSMLADVVEDHAVRTGHRSEGLFFAANGILQKMVGGLGTFAAGLLLAALDFPRNASPETVSPALMHKLGMIYVPIALALAVACLLVLGLFRIDRAQHAENLEQLRRRDAADPPPGAVDEIALAPTAPVRPVQAL